MKNKIFDILRDGDNKNRLGRIVDWLLIILILINTLALFLNTFEGIASQFESVFYYIEFISVVIFSIEYLLRVYIADKFFPSLSPLKARLKYVVSFLAIIDLLAILPFYLPLIIRVDLRFLRMFRLLRLMRLFKLNRYTKALTIVWSVIRNKKEQIVSSMLIVFALMIISSLIMYSLEHDAQPEAFVNAFSGLYWSIVTITTVGYGDIYPVTTLGKVLGITIAFLGISFVAVPTGIISSGFIENTEKEKENKKEAKNFCPFCGKKLD